METALRLRPELVLTDVSLPGLGGLAATCRLRDELPGTRVVFLTARGTPRSPPRPSGPGPWATFCRRSQRELTRALQAVLLGEQWLSPALAGGRPDALPSATQVPGPLGRLSPRKRAVIQLLAEGNSMKQTAVALGISARTVAFHKYQAMEALSVTSSAQLVRFAVENRLLAVGGN